MGGAEVVVRELDQLLAPRLYALVDGESRRPGSWLAGRSVTTSFIQRLPWGVRRVQLYLSLLPLAVEQLDLSGHGLVVSSSHLVAKGVLTGPDQLHVSYVHSPPRYAWDQMNVYLRHNAMARGPLGPWIRWQLHQLRQWDHLSAQRVDVLVANSRFTARRIWRCWRRRSVVIHPPVAVERFHWQAPRQDFYLCLGRLVAYKRVDLVVEAFNRCRLPLVVVGDGPERQRLLLRAGPTVRLLGQQSAHQVEDLLGRCRALVHAGVEDFGIAPVEAMAAGAPVIAWGKGVSWIPYAAITGIRPPPPGCCLIAPVPGCWRRPSATLKTSACGGSCRRSGCGARRSGFPPSGFGDGWKRCWTRVGGGSRGLVVVLHSVPAH